MLDAQALVAIGAAFTAGILSIPHCAAMCGPFAGFACSRTPDGIAPNLRYQGGRLVAYGALGAVAGTASSPIRALFDNEWVFAITSWLLALALLVAAHRLWDRSGSRVVRTIGIRSRFDRWTSALARNLPTEPAAYGVITALLPCGALYAALLVAASAASPAGGALSMIVFALTSSVGLLAFGWFARRSSRASAGSWRRALAVALLVGAVLLAIRPIGALTADEPSHACCHG